MITHSVNLEAKRGEEMVEVRDPHDAYRVVAYAVGRSCPESIGTEEFKRINVAGAWYEVHKDGERRYVIVGDQLIPCDSCGTPCCRLRDRRICIHCQKKRSKRTNP